MNIFSGFPFLVKSGIFGKKEGEVSYCQKRVLIYIRIKTEYN